MDAIQHKKITQAEYDSEIKETVRPEQPWTLVLKGHNGPKENIYYLKANGRNHPYKSGRGADLRKNFGKHGMEEKVNRDIIDRGF